MSFDAVGEPGGIDEIPALLDARRRVLRLLHRPHDALELAAALEDDPALLLRVLRAANALEGRAGTVGSALAAVRALGRTEVAAIAGRAPVYDPERRPGPWGAPLEAYRAHVAAVREVAERLASEAGGAPRELAATVVLHDVGALALRRAEPAYDRLVDATASPEERLRTERGALGIDHAELGGWLARRWLLPEPLAEAIEHHHADAPGLAALVRLADMLVHARDGRAIDLGELSATVAAAGVPPTTIRAIAFDALGAAT